MQLLMMEKILVYIISLVENDMIEMLDLTLNLLDFLFYMHSIPIYYNIQNCIFIKMKCVRRIKKLTFFFFFFK